MYSKDDIVRMLNEGTSIEDIAKSMTDTLNSAHDAFVAAQEEKERQKQTAAFKSGLILSVSFNFPYKNPPSQ